MFNLSLFFSNKYYFKKSKNIDISIARLNKNNETIYIVK